MFCSRRYLQPNAVRTIPRLVRSNTQATPNPPLDLDPSLRALLQDVDISLTKHKAAVQRKDMHRELEVISSVGSEPATPVELDHEDHWRDRKSPAARFGANQIGAVVLPFELRKSIDSLISKSDKHQLRSDAQRLFLDSEQEGTPEWGAKYDPKYRSRLQASRHSERDGTAFASVVLPAHFSAVYAVLHQAKRRLGPEWEVNKVIDWGAGTGSALWATLCSFQKSAPQASADTVNEAEIAGSSIVECIGIDKRDGLVTIGKHLFSNVNLGALSIRFQKSFKEDDRIKRSNGQNALAISAFLLSSLPTPQLKKALVKEMWESGAHVIILIDHNTQGGFESIAAAREYLLNVGRKEFEDPETKDWPIKGSHVVAPCPHDGPCPLYHPGSNKLVCGFSQRLQRPEFVRLTKHSGVGHEDIGYSYVVVRRGHRPSAGDIKFGRLGEVGKWALAKEALQRVTVRELQLHGHHHEARASGMETLSPVDTEPPRPIEPESSTTPPESREDMEQALRLEAYSWPRLVFPPLKRSGHVILDCCTVEGKIMRMTIPKSQGKQAYYDARKSDWGDSFPHAPKNAPQERHQPARAKRYAPIKGGDIGKRSVLSNKANESYEAVSEDLKAKRRQQRRERQTKDTQTWVD